MKVNNTIFMLIAIVGVIGFFSTWVVIDDQMMAMIEFSGLEVYIPKTGLEFFSRGWEQGTTELYTLILVPLVFLFVALYHTRILGKWHILLVKLIELLPIIYFLILLFVLSDELNTSISDLYTMSKDYLGMIGWGFWATILASILLIFDPVRLRRS